ELEKCKQKQGQKQKSSSTTTKNDRPLYKPKNLPILTYSKFKAICPSVQLKAFDVSSKSIETNSNQQTMDSKLSHTNSYGYNNSKVDNNNSGTYTPKQNEKNSNICIVLANQVDEIRNIMTKLEQ